jgi:hypothetical protein
MVFTFNFHNTTILVCASLSILGCLVIIIFSLFFKKLRSYTFRLVTYLAIADLFASISKNQLGFIIPGYENSAWCLTQAILQNYSQMASLFITGIISFSLYEMIVNSNMSIAKNEKLFITGSFLLPIVLTPLPLITNSYGDSNGWCWVKYNELIDTFWMIFEFYGLLMAMILMNAYFYYRIYKRLAYDECLSLDREVVKKVMSRIKWYPLILMICFGPSLIHRIYYLIQPSENMWINLASASMCALYGFINAVVYGMTKKVRTVFKISLKNLFFPHKTIHSLSNTHSMV